MGIACVMTAVLGFIGAHSSLIHMWSGIVYGLAHIITYGSSVAYHFAEYPPLKTRLRAVDQAAIYAAIAGTYTPLLLLGLPGMWGPALTVAVWLVCVRGVFMRIKGFREEGSDWASLASYLTFASLGFLLFVFVGAGPIAASRAEFAISAALFGVGLVFYMWHYKPYFHTAWHVFTVLGHVVHFYAFWRFFM